MREKYRNYTNDEVINYVKEVKSIAGLLRKLNLTPAGGNYTHIKKLLQTLKVNCDHWTGKGWRKEQQLKDWKDYSKVRHIKKHLLKLKGNVCEKCNLKKWLETDIPLEVHHLDGNRTNNELENLQLLCCNCHALTPNWRNRNR